MLMLKSRPLHLATDSCCDSCDSCEFDRARGGAAAAHASDQESIHKPRRKAPKYTRPRSVCICCGTTQGGSTMANGIKRAALHVRVLTEHQSVENQVRELSQVAEHRGWKRGRGLSRCWHQRRRGTRSAARPALLKDANRGGAVRDCPNGSY